MAIKSEVKPMAKAQFKSQSEKIKTLYFKPTLFFQKVAGESKYFPILIYFVIISAIAYVINWALSVIQASSTPGASAEVILGAVFGLWFVVFSVGFSFAVPFVNAGVVHLGVLMYRGRKSYFNTFKPEAYAMVVGMIYGMIFYVANFILWLVAPFEITESTVQSLTGILNSIPVSYYVVYILLFIISLVHTLYIEVIGVAKFQEMNKGRSLLAILTPRIILLLLIVIPLILLFQFILSISPPPV
jgi:hypothetical protein